MTITIIFRTKARNAAERGRGQVLHSVMSRIRSKEDIKEALERSLLDGDIGSGDFPEYMKEITEAVLSVESYGWFTGKYDVLNEIEIVEPGGKISRPDRVLVSGRLWIISSGHRKNVTRSRSRAIWCCSERWDTGM